MGREIRKVPKGWEHPKDEQGEYKSMHDEYFEDAFNEWEQNRLDWIAGKNEDQKRNNYGTTNAEYIEWAGTSPDPEYYRSVKWTEEEACCFQMYQTVSEGTPVSPVFETLQGLEDWLVEQGHSRKAAKGFCESGSAPSFIMNSATGEIKSNVDIYD